MRFATRRWQLCFGVHTPFRVHSTHITKEEDIEMNREQATNLANSALDELVSALNAGRSDTLVRYLNMLSRFHRYSFQNCMLIALQRPDATYVAGFTRWKELGRHERKDERGIGILAPLLYRKTGEDKDIRRSFSRTTASPRSPATSGSW